MKPKTMQSFRECQMGFFFSCYHTYANTTLRLFAIRVFSFVMTTMFPLYQDLQQTTPVPPPAFIAQDITTLCLASSGLRRFARQLVTWSRAQARFRASMNHDTFLFKE